MSAFDDLRFPFIPTVTYHLFNRGINGGKLFFRTDNFRYFLERFQFYSTGYWDTLAYCLVPNHFHFAIRIKPVKAIVKSVDRDFRHVDLAFVKKMLLRYQLPKHLGVAPASFELQNFRNYAISHGVQVEAYESELAQWAVSERIRRFLLGYVKAINKETGRKGSLMQKTVRRKAISEEIQIKRLVAYIHRNPIHHQLDDDYQEYLWSSYQAILLGDSTMIDGAALLESFGGKEGYLEFHEAYVEDWKEGMDL